MRTSGTRTHSGALAFIGGGNMACSLDDAPAGHLRQRVTSPGGTTQAAVDDAESGGFRAPFERAIDATTIRGRELAAASG